MEEEEVNEKKMRELSLKGTLHPAGSCGVYDVWRLAVGKMSVL